MSAIPQASATGREYHTIVPIEGYVHKFRLEARHADAPEPIAPTVNVGALLGKFVLIALAFAAFATLALIGAPAQAKDIELLNVSYDPTRELYDEYNKVFAVPGWR